MRKRKAPEPDVKPVRRAPKSDCPNAHFHRAGTYCKQCRTIAS